ncbi:MAG TPA: hypothetical protein DHV14_07170, partial [Micrococcales bacterium]|nr:hypothetical protein [Micrococcales bacterium]
MASDQVPDALGVVAPGEVVQVLDGAGRVVATSANASLTLPVVSLADVADEAAESARTGEPVLTTADSAYTGSARVAVLAVPGAEGSAAGDGSTATDGSAAGDVVVAAVPLGDVAATIRALALALVAVVPVLVLGLGVVVWVVLGRALRPVEDLRVAADAVAAEGGRGSLPVPASGELAALATTLNAMLDRLDGAVQAAQRSARREHEAATRQRAFVADAAHELRSPITGLRAALDVAREHPEAYPAADLVPDLDDGVRRMEVLVEDLLLLARVGSRPLARERVALA